MPKAKLTNIFVKAVPIPTKPKELYSDIDEIGLVLEVRSSGTKCFYYRYNEHNKTKYKKIENYPTITANKARELVHKLKLEASKDKCISLTYKQPTITLESFFNDKYTSYLQTAKKTYKEDIKYFNTHILPNFGKYPMDKITTQMVSDKHTSLKRTNKLAPSTCNKFLHYLSKCYNTAIDWNIQGVTNNPTTKVKCFIEDNKVERFLNKSEIQTLLSVLDNQSNPQIQSIILFLLLTGEHQELLTNVSRAGAQLGSQKYLMPNGKTLTLPINSGLYPYQRIIK